MYTLFGIPNCNTVKKAKDALDAKKISYEFVNFKKTPPTKAQLKLWKEAFGDWPVNKKGPTYRKIKDEFEAASAPEKYKILMETTSAIKRPILTTESDVISFGFSEDIYSAVK